MCFRKGITIYAFLENRRIIINEPGESQAYIGLGLYGAHHFGYFYLNYVGFTLSILNYTLVFSI